MKTNLFKQAKKKDSINIITLGCSKNTVDSEVLLTQLEGSKLDAKHESSDPDANIVVVNTCGFIDKAKEESINTILEQVQRKQEGQIEKLYVTGCLSQRYRETLESEIPEVDRYFGTGDMPDLVQELGADYKKELLGERLTTTDSHYAYLKIAEGCNRPCSFCAIPLMRGKHKSREIDFLVKEAGFLAKKGVKELMLIAQDLTYYGIDLYGKRRLGDLLLNLAEVEGIEWIRLHYAYPSGFPREILPIIRDNPKICNYLDIPLQHVSDPVLKSMRRGITQKRTYDLLHEIRNTVPDIAIRTTMMVGHPGEREEDHQELLRFVETFSIDRLGVFTYSHEENTHAGNVFEDIIPEEVKERRMEEVMELQQDISLELNRKKVDKELPVIIDRWEGEYYVGRTEHDSPEVDNEVMVHTSEELEIGNIYQVRITDALEYDLIAEF